MPDSKQRMAGEYAIIQAFHIGDREVVLGENPSDATGRRYMCAFCQMNELFAEYSEVLISSKYPQIVKIFGERVAAQAEKTRVELEEEAKISSKPLREADCTLLSSEDNLNGEVIVIKADVLRQEYQMATRQLKLCVGGFGADPHSRGSTVLCQDLYSGRLSRFDRWDILGTMAPEALPTWARRNLKELQIDDDTREELKTMINLKIKTATPADRLYAAKQSTQIAGQTGYIGQMQADRQGDAKTWTERDHTLYTDDFRQDLDAVLQALKGQPENEAENTLGLRADTERYSFFLRPDPEKDETELVIHCYLRERLDRHMKHAEQGIRFITPNYRERFRIPDGDTIRIQHSDGTHRDFVCRYIDETHLEVGNGLYHICQLAELMQRQGSTVIPLRSSLPEKSFSFLESTGELIVITRGEMGYQPTGQWAQDMSPQEGADALNDTIGVTKAQAAAMKAGSLFGWDTPTADPKNYDEQGQAIKPRHRDRGDAR